MLPMVATQRLGWVRAALLLVWAAASFGTCFYARDLPSWLGNQSLAYGLAAQAIPIVFIALVVVNACVFNRSGQREAGAAAEPDAGA